MATYSSASKQLISNYACISTLEQSEIVVGENITVSGLAAPFAGTFKVLDLPQYEFTGVDSTTGEFQFNPNVARPNQIIYACTGTSVNYVVDYTGSVVHNQNCTWITTAELVTYLGVTITNPSDDYTLATQARNAANDFCYRRRQEAGYFDSLSTSPSGDCTLATIMLSGAYFRQRGSIDQFSSFDAMGQAITTNAFTPMVKQLLGIDRPAVA